MEEISKKELGLNSKADKPIIVMSFITLIKFYKLFSKYGFKKYFDEYINKTTKNKIFNKTVAVNNNLSFDDFMSVESYDISDEIKDIVNDLKVDIREYTALKSK